MVDFFVHGGGDHHVLWLQEATHHVQNGGFPHGRGVGHFGAEWRVPRHQEVEVGGGYEGGDQADEIVVHVGGVAEGGRRDRHDGRNQLVDL